MKISHLIISACLLNLPFLGQAQTCGTTNIAQGKPVTVSQEQQYHLGPDAVDGNGSTGWYAPGDNNHIYVDLLQSYSICRVTITWTNNGKAKAFKLQVSTDAINWTDVDERTTNNSNTNDFQSLVITGRYVRVLVTERVNSWSSLEMLELKVYNSLAGNTKPSVILTTPTNNANFFSGSNLTLTASASDPDGTISKVEFYQGSEKIGEVASAPFTFIWSNVQPGNFTLRAKAYDNANADSLSVGVNIVVNPTTRWSLQGNGGTNPDTTFLGTTDNKRLVFKTNSIERMTLLTDGFVGIGTSVKPHSEAKLAVNGALYSKKLKVTQTGWADYVFNADYKLPTLHEVEEFIKRHGHLPGVPTTAQVEKEGTDVAEIQATLLKKIEELTLYVLQQEKKLEAQRKEIEALKNNAKNASKN